MLLMKTLVSNILTLCNIVFTSFEWGKICIIFIFLLVLCTRLRSAVGNRDKNLSIYFFRVQSISVPKFIHIGFAV